MHDLAVDFPIPLNLNSEEILPSCLWLQFSSFVYVLNVATDVPGCDQKQLSQFPLTKPHCFILMQHFNARFAVFGLI